MFQIIWILSIMVCNTQTGCKTVENPVRYKTALECRKVEFNMISALPTPPTIEDNVPWLEVSCLARRPRVASDIPVPSPP